MKLKMLLLSVAILLLSGCGEKTGDEVTYADKFVEVEHRGNSAIYVDAETKVMYWEKAFATGVGLTVVLNEDGTPKLWEGELPNYK